MSGRRWLITGVSGGLGRALAEAALARGDMVAGTFRVDTADFERLAPGRAHAVHLDLSRLRDIPAAIDGAIARLGGIDILVNNAGYCLAGAVEEVADAEAQDIFAVNLFAPLAVIRTALPHLRAAGSGRIINISSLAALETYPGLGLYCASKAAFSALSETLGLELQSLAVHVTAVEAGGMRTGFAGSSLRKAARRSAAYLPMRNEVEAGFRHSDGKQANDPVAIALALIELSLLEQPPARLAIGEGARERVEARLDALRALYGAHSL